MSPRRRSAATRSTRAPAAAILADRRGCLLANRKDLLRAGTELQFIKGFTRLIVERLPPFQFLFQRRVFPGHLAELPGFVLQFYNGCFLGLDFRLQPPQNAL